MRFGCDVLWRGRSAFTEEVLLHLFDYHFLVLSSGGIQAVLIEQHLAELRPLVPSLLRHVLVDLLAQFSVEGRLFESGKLLLQFDAKNLMLCHENFLSENYRTAAPEASGVRISVIRIFDQKSKRPAQAGLAVRISG
jgi:hypothetical protein